MYILAPTSEKNLTKNNTYKCFNKNEIGINLRKVIEIYQICAENYKTC